MPKVQQRGTVLAELNVTPLVDVMLVLLIIVLVTAPLVHQGVDLELPEASAKPVPSQEGKVIVSIDRKGVVKVDGKPVALSGVERAVAENPKAQADGEVYIYADKTLTYGLVLKVMAAIQRAGIRRIGLMTNPVTAEEAAGTGSGPAGASGP